MTPRRWLTLGVLLVMGVFALQGGEYSIGDYWELERRLEVERDSAPGLTALVDTLERRLEAAETDPAVQERIAREIYGMIRPGEHLYRVTEP